MNNKTEPRAVQSQQSITAWRALTLGLCVTGMVSCSQIPASQVSLSQDQLTITVSTTASDTAAQLEARYSGTMVNFQPSAGFAILSSHMRPSASDTAVKGVDVNAKMSAPVVLTVNDAGLSPESAPIATSQTTEIGALKSWSGGWQSWSGGWQSWSGGWQSWSGGSALEAPNENQSVWDSMRLDQAHKISRNFGAGIKIAVLDTGIDQGHPAFVGRLVPEADREDFFSTTVGDNNPQEEGVATVDNGFGHGTGVAGVILQVAPKATIMPIRVLGKDGSGDLDQVIQGMQWAIDHGAKIINMSLGSTQDYTAMTTMIKYAASKKVFMVASAGNAGIENGMTSPAHLPNHVVDMYLYGIGSVNSSNILSGFSNYGFDMFMAAPGENITSSFPGSRLAQFTGTSFSAPVFAGSLALILGERNSWNLPDTSLRAYMMEYVDRGNFIQNNYAARGTWNAGSGHLNLEAYIRNLGDWVVPNPMGTVNLVPNGSFETGGFAGWTSVDKATLVTGTNSVGPTAVKLNVTNLDADSGYIGRPISGLKSNTNYVMSAWIHVSQLAGIEHYDADSLISSGAQMGVSGFGGAQTSILVSSGVRGGYSKKKITFKTGPNSTTAWIWLKAEAPQTAAGYGGVGSSTVLVDDVSVVESGI